MGTYKRFRPAYGLIILAAIVLAFLLLYDRPVVPVLRPAGDGPEAVTIFFPDGRGKLGKKMVEVQKNMSNKARADIIFRELKGARSIPDRLRLYDMAVGQDGVLYLNLSKEFMDPGSPAREVTMVYSLVDSFLASFPNTKSVQLLVEGKAVYTRSGLLYILEPLQFNKELLED
jgi:hypothetical protein